MRKCVCVRESERKRDSSSNLWNLNFVVYLFGELKNLHWSFPARCDVLVALSVSGVETWIYVFVGNAFDCFSVSSDV